MPEQQCFAIVCNQDAYQQYPPEQMGSTPLYEARKGQGERCRKEPERKPRGWDPEGIWELQGKPAGQEIRDGDAQCESKRDRQAGKHYGCQQLGSSMQPGDEQVG